MINLHQQALFLRKMASIMIHLLPIILGMITSGMLLTVATQQGRKVVADNEYRLPKIYLYASYFVLLLIPTVLSLPLLAPNPVENGASLIIILASLFLILGAYLVGYYRSHKIIIEENTLIISYVFRKTKRFELNEIKSIKLNTFTHLVSITDRYERIASFHFHMVGLTALLKKIEEKSGVGASDIEKLLLI